MGVIYKEEFENEKILADLFTNIDKIKRIADGSSDLLVNEIEVSGVKTILLCCEGMLSTATITELILHPLTKINIPFIDGPKLFEHINNKMLLSIDRPIVKNYGDLFRTLNSGFAVLIAEGTDKALAFGVQGYATRGISEPSTEGNILGSHEGFVETIRTNMSLIRRRMKSPFLKMELSVMGDKSKTDLCLCYLRDRVPKKLLKEIKDSLANIELETILSSGYVRPFLEKDSNSIFDSVGMTERPDVLCSKLLEGRVALFIDGTPFALFMPKLFNENFQTLDDYNYKLYYVTFIRWLKYFAFLIVLLLPALYVAIAVHHPEMLNSTLLMILADSEQTAPFSMAAEAIGVLIMYEIIRESGIRLPQVVGGAVSIVGGLIIGDAAVKSGFITTPMLTVIALSVISGFVVPELNQSITVLRLLFIMCGGLWGLYGISLLGTIVLFNICATENYGFPITAPISPFYPKAMRDILTRIGFKKMQNGNFTVESLKK